jgi:phage shock protein C
MKKLYKSKENKVFSGVIGGLGEYFEIDPVLLRLVWLFFLVFTGIIPGLFFYLLASLIVPKKQ